MSPFRLAGDNAATPSQARAAVLLSWLALSVLGVFVIAQHWVGRGQLDQGVARALLFEIIITSVCIAAYLLYCRQSFVATQKINDCPATPFNIADFRSALRVGLLFQLPIVLLAALLLDGGRAFHITTVAAFAYWPMLGLIYFNRRESPTFLDLVAIRYGYIVILLIVSTVGPAVWTKLGRW